MIQCEISKKERRHQQIVNPVAFQQLATPSHAFQPVKLRAGVQHPGQQAGAFKSITPTEGQSTPVSSENRDSIYYSVQSIPNPIETSVYETHEGSERPSTEAVELNDVPAVHAKMDMESIDEEDEQSPSEREERRKSCLIM